jgi:deazaflavin-dependent oxidoreductase (nitroreductase family)
MMAIMSEESDIARRMRRRAKRMRRGNVVMRRLLNLPFRTPVSGNLMLIFYTGRRSGKPYQQPVSYTVDGDVLLTPGGGRWKANLEDGQSITARIRGRTRQVTPELVRNPNEVERLLKMMTERNPRLASFVPFVSRSGDIDPAGLDLALANGFCIVRWHLDGGLQSSVEGVGDRGQLQGVDERMHVHDATVFDREGQDGHDGAVLKRDDAGVLTYGDRNQSRS